MEMNITEFLVIARIRQLCAKKGWSYYRLAKESGIPYSTLNTMMLKTNAPSITTLSKICNGLGVTLAQFFDEQSEPEMLTHEQRECLRIWDSLNRTEKKQAIAYMQGLHERMQD
jgi:transcriptional regulator with XRE-family HTH domain